jgi:hypothetical protein
MTEIRDAVLRNRATLAQDFAGAVALVCILLVGLSFPAFL